MTEESGSPIQDIPTREPVATLVPPPLTYTVHQNGTITINP